MILRRESVPFTTARMTTLINGRGFPPDVDGPDARSIVDRAMSRGSPMLLEDESKRLCALYGIGTPPFRVAVDADEAVESARAVGYPVVMKVLSPQIVHKTDVGGVALDLERDEDVRAAYDRVVRSVRNARPDAEIAGVLVERQLPASIEVIVGATVDGKFGPVLMFGMGGTLAELLRDVAFRLIPVGEDDARAMVEEVRGSDVLMGLRGRPPLDIDALIGVLLSTSRIMLENPEISGVDLNPVIVYERGAVAVDAKIFLGPPRPTQGEGIRRPQP